MDKKGVLKNPVTKTELKRVEQTLSKKIDRNSEKIGENAKKIDSLDEKVDRLTRQVVENTDWIKNKLVTKEEFEKKFNRLLDGEDSMMGILRRIEQECAFRGRRIEKTEGDVEKNKEEIRKIKTKLAMV